jgi:hypothetical protein
MASVTGFSYKTGDIQNAPIILPDRERKDMIPALLMKLLFYLSKGQILVL